LILKAQVFGALGVSDGVQAAPFDIGRRWRKRRDPSAASTGVKKALSFNWAGRSSGVAVAEFQIPLKPE